MYINHCGQDGYSALWAFAPTGAPYDNVASLSRVLHFCIFVCKQRHISRPAGLGHGISTILWDLARQRKEFPFLPIRYGYSVRDPSPPPLSLEGEGVRGLSQGYKGTATGNRYGLLVPSCDQSGTSTWGGSRRDATYFALLKSAKTMSSGLIKEPWKNRPLKRKV